MKKCAVCGQPLQAGPVVHAECLPRWIPVTERMPEPMKQVMVYDQGSKRVDVDWILIIDHEFLCHDHVTHWMPLPQPPKGVE